MEIKALLTMHEAAAAVDAIYARLEEVAKPAPFTATQYGYELEAYILADVALKLGRMSFKGGKPKSLKLLQLQADAVYRATGHFGKFARIIPKNNALSWS